MFKNVTFDCNPKNPLSGEDLDDSRKQSTFYVVLFYFVRLYTSKKSQSLHQLLQGLY